MAYPHSPYPPPPPPPSRGGGGKALPIAVGAGLAVGVFVGLLVLRGTGSEAEASDEPSPDAAVVATATPDAPVAVPVDAAPVPDAKPEPKKAVLTFDVDGPDEVDITVDDKDVEGKTHEILLGDADKVKVRVVARARGYRHFRDSLEISADQTVEIKMRRRGGGNNTGTKPGTGKKPPGGIIDL
jgi:hypothetical protein